MANPSVLSVDEETDLAQICGWLQSLVQTTQDFFIRVPNPDAHQRLMLWDELTFMHLLVSRIEVVVLGLDFEAYQEKQSEMIKGRKVVQE